MRFLICSLLAVGISMIVVLPIVLVVMDAGRIGADFYTPIILSQEYDSGIISGFTTTSVFSSKQNWHRLLLGTSLLLNSYHRGFFVLSVQSGSVQNSWRDFL